MKRSLTLLDNFMSNTLHFVRTPCNVMMGGRGCHSSTSQLNLRRFMSLKP